MRLIRCAICGSGYVNGATNMIQSERFPSVYIHSGPCWMAIFRVFHNENWPWNPLLHELYSKQHDFDGYKLRAIGIKVPENETESYQLSQASRHVETGLGTPIGFLGGEEECPSDSSDSDREIERLREEDPSHTCQGEGEVHSLGTDELRIHPLETIPLD